MVLQQNATIRVWGWADAGEKVVYTLNSVSKEFSLADTTQDMCLFVEVPDDVDSAFSLSEGDLIITYNADGD